MRSDPPPAALDDGFGQSADGAPEVLAGLVRMARVAQHRQRTLLVALALSCGLGAAYYATAPRSFRSEARLMVVGQGGEDVAGVADQAGADSVMTTHKELVRSPVVVQRAIEGLAPEHRVDLSEVSPDRWVRTVTRRLAASNVRKTNFINVSYESLAPEASAAVVRGVIEAYLAFVEETQRGAAADVLAALTAERDRLDRELHEKQQLLQTSRERAGRLALPDRDDVLDPVIARAIRVNDAMIEAQQTRVGLQASLATVRAAISRGEDLRQHVGLVEESVGQKVMLAAMGMGENDVAILADQQKRLLELDAELARVAPFFGPAHPRVRSLREQADSTRQYLASYGADALGRPDGRAGAEIGPLLVSMLSQAIARAEDEERRLAESFELARAEASRQSGEFVRLEMLDREVARLEKQHDALFDKIAAIDIHQVQAPIRVTIVQEPLPDPRPASPQLRIVLAASVIGGLVIGLALAYVQDALDDRFGSPDEMASRLGRPVLAVVRQLDSLPGEGIASVQMHARPQAAESEAFRTLRTAIALASEVSERLVVSSSEPGDGKTTVSANLAASYAQSGKRTLLIDADLRKPGLTALLSMKGKPGLTDILTTQAGAGPTAERVVRTVANNLDVIPAGPRRPDPAELLLGSALPDLLAWADGRYDQVLVDCPPVLAVSDAQIVSRLVDGVVLVVTPEKNHRRLVARACDQFRATGTPLVGVVANRVSAQAGRGYGYGYGYGYGHEDLPGAADLADEGPPSGAPAPGSPTDASGPIRRAA